MDCFACGNNKHYSSSEEEEESDNVGTKHLGEQVRNVSSSNKLRDLPKKKVFVPFVFGYF